jgi:hypothetical protein
MAGSKSDYLENKVLDHALGTTSFTMPADVYVGLYTVAPTDSGGGTEVSGNGYAREIATFSAASGGATSNDSDITFDTPTNTWGTVVAFGLFDALTTGNLLYWGDLTANKTINSGDTVKFLTGDLDISES